MAVAQAARDFDVHENVLRKWIRDAAVDQQHAFPGQGVMRPEQAELERLRKENAKLRMERDLLNTEGHGRWQ
ncbi:transposase-like protein [Variovorax ginsengisoli]|uniref:Transposase-like protein n=1 Tax=Variovorax ginsengisoli TaxID=363844 RepID=A0ABT9SBH4_9BURK|nr:transposase-like protein [Variovorax ginsengisoli]